MSHDELEKALGKCAVGSSLEQLAAMRDIANPLADTFRTLQDSGVDAGLQGNGRQEQNADGGV